MKLKNRSAKPDFQPDGNERMGQLIDAANVLRQSGWAYADALIPLNKKAKQLSLATQDAKEARRLAWKTDGDAPTDGDEVAELAESRLETVRADEIEMRVVTWLWDKRIPRGKLTLLVGDPDAGKSTLAIYIAARLTMGEGWPDGADAPKRGKVIYMSTEDDPSDTLSPRLRAAGADLSRIHFLKCTLHRDSNTGEFKPAAFTLADVEALDKLARRLGNVAAVIFDPISAFAGKISSKENAEVRRTLAPVIELAANRNFAVIGLQHMNKQATAAMYRSMDSIAWIAQARAAWLVVVDPTDDTGEQRLLIRLKGNLAKNPGGLCFGIKEKSIPELPGQRIPYLKWERGVIKTTADQVLAPPARETKKDAAAEFVHDWMDGQRKVAAPSDTEIRAAGFTPNAVFRARQALGIDSQRANKGKGWIWKKPLIRIKPQTSNHKDK